ncbi:unnamed protein product [Allacma fusca]|uniref:GTPase-activating protein CdGAPr n=1 Tax=Allacma fusca TaxID=39272 RepID=A0A8J2LQB7_9HEXA|nr:unnamed protein product [Allacma fusca]
MAAESGIWEASEVETSRGSIRIQHLTTAAVSAGARPLSGSTTSGGAVPSLKPRFPKLEECAHFHYDIVELPALKREVLKSDNFSPIFIRDEVSKPISGPGDEIVADKCSFPIEVVSGGQSWVIRRTYANIHKLDEQLHCCVWDRGFSQLELVVTNEACNTSEEHDGCRAFVERYCARLSELPTNQITCGTVLSWFELDNRGRHIVASDDSAINTPAVAAACALRKYTAQATDEISFEVGDMISVIDMPPPEESIWWRGKRGFHVGFFPRECVQVIGDKVPASLPIVPSTRRLQRLSVSSTNSSSVPAKPVLRKHGKLIAFFRSFILSRPSRRRLKQTGILRERVFGCDLAEHLLNSSNEIPAVLKCCADFIEMHGIVDGIYRLSGITSNIQKLRNAFDEDKVPNLEEDEAIKQDIHAVSSLLKMYFRELPNPLCTYQLYDKFVAAAQASDIDRLFRMREVVHELPPPHYRTLEYLMKHLARVANRSNETGMTPKNMAIVWAPNLIRCKELEAGGVAALKGIGVQAVVTEYLVRHADLIFNDKLPTNLPPTTTLVTQRSISSCSTTGRPRSLAISSPIRLMSLEEAQDKAKDDRKYIEVGGGPSSLPPKYHTVIDLPGRRSTLKKKRSPIGWRHLFSRNGSFSKPRASKVPTPCEISTVMSSMPAGMMPMSLQSAKVGRLRPVKSVESLVSSPLYLGPMTANPGLTCVVNDSDDQDQSLAEPEELADDGHKVAMSKSSPATPVTDVHVVFHAPPEPKQINKALSTEPRPLQNPKTHNRSISHDSYFEFGEFRNGNNVYIDETLEEETMSQESSKLSLDNISSSGLDSVNTSPRKDCSSGGFGGDTESITSKSHGRNSFRSPITPPPSAASIRGPMNDSFTSAISSSSDDYFFVNDVDDSILPTSPPLRPRLKQSKWRDSVVVGEDSSSSASVYTGHCTNSSDDTNVNPNVIRFKESFELQEEPESSQFSFKPLQNSSSSVSSSKYELDKNSSVDESSAESTPAGVQGSELSSDAEIETSPTTTTSTGASQAGTDSEAITTPVASNEMEITGAPQPQYANVPLPSPSQRADEPLTESQFPPAHQSEKHVYQNERVYQNELTDFESTQSGTVVARNEEGDAEEDMFDEDLYAQHYENVSDEDEGVDKANTYGGSNIYEDIDDEQTLLAPSSTNTREDKNNYETVKVSSRPESSVPIISPLGSTTEESLEDNHSDADIEGTYESVQYSRNDENEMIAHHHYAEICEKPDVNTYTYVTNQPLKPTHSSEDSSESHSHTEDMVTYLEVQTPGFLKLRSDSVDEQEHIQEESFPSTESTSVLTSPVQEQEEIRHIDSPVIVDNPLYGLESDIKTNEDFLTGMSCTQMEEMHEVKETYRNNKVLGRCNSAPLTGAVGFSDMTLSVPSHLDDDDLDDFKDISIKSDSALDDKPSQVTGNGESSDNPVSKLILCKRLSEPSLLFAQNIPRQTKSKIDERVSAWKIADAKRLANRKQSVKELLTKFETPGDSSKSGTNQNTNQGSNNNVISSSHGTGPGLPRPDSKQNLNATMNDNFVKVNNNNNNTTRGRHGGSGRFQHHRFSMGDILMSQSMTSADELSSMKSVASNMVRSDTFPELRTDASKENDHSGDIGSCPHSLSDNGPPLVAEKVQQALRVAMSSVDMNDPSTRERIEKYKEERRNYLRQKINSEIGQKSPSSESKSSVCSMKSPDRDSISSTDSVFTTATVKIISPSESNGNINVNRCSESPRKRAFSEDIPSAYFNQIKTIKTDSFPAVKPMLMSPQTPPTKHSVNANISSSESMSSMSAQEDGSQEEVNVKEKVALWAVRKRALSTNTSSSTTTTTSEHNIHKTKDDTPFPKPILKEAVSLPPEGFTKLPILRREVTASSVEISKTTTTKLRSSSTNGGKKIKDMAAFFEAKQF